MALGLLRVASEPAVANLHQRAGASALRTARVQAMHALGFEFPANGGFQIARVTGDPGLDQEARRINFEVLAADLEGVAVGADARAFPFAVDTQVGFEIGDAVHLFLSPPLRELARVGDGLKDAGRRCGNEDLAADDVLIGSNCDGCHGALLA